MAVRAVDTVGPPSSLSGSSPVGANPSLLSARNAATPTLSLPRAHPVNTKVEAATPRPASGYPGSLRRGRWPTANAVH